MNMYIPVLRRPPRPDKEIVCANTDNGEAESEKAINKAAATEKGSSIMKNAASMWAVLTVGVLALGLSAATAGATLVTIDNHDFEDADATNPTDLFNNTAWVTDSADVESDFNVYNSGNNTPSVGDHWFELDNSGVSAWQSVTTVKENVIYTMEFNLTSNTSNDGYEVGLWADTNEDATPDMALVSLTAANDGLESGYGFSAYSNYEPTEHGYAHLEMQFNTGSQALPGDIAHGDALFVYARRDNLSNMAIDEITLAETPIGIPEPTTLVLFLLGMTGLLTRRLRRRA
jgi:hypothetical protein